MPSFYLLIYIPKYGNIACLVHVMLLVSMYFSGLTTWDWIANWGVLSGEGFVSHSQQSLVAHSSSCRVGSPWDPCPPCCMPVGGVLPQVLFRQPCWWALRVLGGFFVIYRRQDLAVAPALLLALFHLLSTVPLSWRSRSWAVDALVGSDQMCLSGMVLSVAK